MVEQARLALLQNGVDQIEFAQGSAEDLSMLQDSSVDLVVSGSVSPIPERPGECSRYNVQHKLRIG